MGGLPASNLSPTPRTTADSVPPSPTPKGWSAQGQADDLWSASEVEISRNTYVVRTYSSSGPGSSLPLAPALCTPPGNRFPGPEINFRASEINFSHSDF